MKKYISKTTSRMYNKALISLMISFTFLYSYLDGNVSAYIFLVILPALISGIYFLATAYSRTKKEL